MPWQGSGNDKSPPDLGDLISKLKDKVQTAFKSRKSQPTPDNDEQLSIATCSCGSENKNYIVDVMVYCGTCSNRLIKKTITHPYKVAALLVVLSYGAGQFVESVIADNRYPLNIEFATLSACTNTHGRPVSSRIHDKKIQVCLCAMEETMNDISYSQFLDDGRGFLDVFEKNTKSCP